jgi:hypothetical protein
MLNQLTIYYLSYVRGCAVSSFRLRTRLRAGYTDRDQLQVLRRRTQALHLRKLRST